MDKPPNKKSRRKPVQILEPFKVRNGKAWFYVDEKNIDFYQISEMGASRIQIPTRAIRIALEKLETYIK